MPGTRRYFSGSKYEGELKSNQRHGQGTKTWKDGSAYEGSWVDDKREGHGVMRTADGTYTGEWRNNMREGRGTIEFSNGSKYEGEFLGNEPHGEGKWNYAGSGNVFEGQYARGVAEGFGKLFLANGDRFEGEWLAGKKTGKGTIFWASGRVFSGTFREDCPIDGEVTEGSSGERFALTFSGETTFGGGAEPISKVPLSETAPSDAAAGRASDPTARPLGESACAPGAGHLAMGHGVGYHPS